MENQLTNMWIRRMLETKLVQIVEWAQKNKKRVEDLTEEEVQEALGEKDKNNDI